MQNFNSKLRISSDEKVLPQLLDEREAAEILQISPATLRLWRKKRKTGEVAPVVPFLQIGRAVRYRNEDLETFLTEQVNV